MEITKNDGSVVGDFRMGVIDGSWTVSYVFEPSMDMTFLACIKHDLDDGDILAYFGNFYFGWYGVNEVKNYSKEFILEKYSDEIFNEDVGDEKSVVENEGEKSIVDESNETVDDDEYIRNIVKLLDEDNTSYAVTLIENGGYLLTDFESELSRLGIKNIYSEKLEKHIERNWNMGATLEDIITLLRQDKTKDAVKIIKKDNWELSDITNELYASGLIRLLCNLDKCIARMDIKVMIRMIDGGDVDYQGICEDREFWNSVHTAMDWSGINPPFKCSFDEYSDEWYEANKESIVKWFKKLAKKMK